MHCFQNPGKGNQVRTSSAAPRHPQRPCLHFSLSCAQPCFPESKAEWSSISDKLSAYHLFPVICLSICLISTTHLVYFICTLSLSTFHFYVSVFYHLFTYPLLTLSCLSVCLPNYHPSSLGLNVHFPQRPMYLVPS